MKKLLCHILICAILFTGIAPSIVQATEIQSISENNIISVSANSMIANADKTTETVISSDILTEKNTAVKASQKYLKFSTLSGNLDENIKNDIYTLFDSVYYDIFDYFNNGNYITVKLIVDDNTIAGGNPAYALCDKYEIHFSSEYLNTYPEDYDLITHELVHIAQMYPYNSRNVPIWLTEGIADYGRNKFGINNENAYWSLEPPLETNHYTDSYKITAAFFDWIDKNYCTNFVQKINYKIKDGSYTHSYIKEITGYTYDQLWENYMKAYNLTIPDVDLTLPTTKPIPAGTDIGSYLTIVNTNNSVNQTYINNVKNTFKKVYDDICTEYNYGELIPTTIIFDPTYDGVAYTVCSEQKIVVSSDYANKFPEDYDCVTHELVHMAQNYTNYTQSWLMEGIADYGRNKFGVNNDAANWELPIYPDMFDGCMGGYVGTAVFLEWITQTYNKNTVAFLNHMLKNNTYNHNVWKKITGYSLLELEEKFYENVPKRIEKRNDKMSNLKLLNDNNEIVKIYDYCKSEYSLIIFGNWDNTNFHHAFKTAAKYKSILGNKIDIVFIFGNQSRSSINKLLKKENKNLAKSINFLEDPKLYACFYSFSKLENDGGVVLVWPSAVLLNAKHKAVVTMDSPDSDLIRNLLAKKYPKCAVQLTDDWDRYKPVVPSAPYGTIIKTNNNTLTYSVTTSSADSPTVTLKSVSKSAKTITIPATIKKNGVTYKVTEISKNAFKNCNKLTSVTIGKNITKIGSNAFYGCKKLKSIVINSTKIKTVNKKAFSGIHKKCIIKVPKTKYDAYNKLFKNKGQKKSVQIKSK